MLKHLLSAVVPALLFYCGLSHACVLRMAAETDFPPHLVFKDQRWQGQSIELLQLLAKEVGCELQFINSPWLRSLAQIKSGELDLVSHLSYSEGRRRDFAFIGPHHIESIWLIGDPDKLPKVSNLKDLTRDVDLGRIAELNGAYYGEEFALLKQNPFFARQLVSISSIQDKLALLEAGRVNAILEDDTVLHYWQNNKYKNAKKYHPLVLVYQSPVYFGFSKKTLSKPMLIKLQKAWQKLYEQGDITTVVQRYQTKRADALTPAAKL
ncbi:transporter substrate-binding domain-containing protein [Rheinheimera sp. 1928-s]|uniref:substrate-binding periplasmic protein n=1 Tax=Rheinheimera sp. 1928-s TaxID=3033803 RepID=UPI00260A0BB1|nr:transporter substrate-binding domain-containing protein [Rheinheimera sp. 1928-s]MDF3126175.1 transporter substrate-binding domain-containing protein [Rheinheimera sp. 1928-s]